MCIEKIFIMYSAKITLKFDSTWKQSVGIYDDEILPEEHITLEVPAEDLNSMQLFRLFEKFCLAMGHNEAGITKGAAYLAFNDMRSFEDMKKTADEYDLVMSEEHHKKVCELEEEVRDLKAKLSRLENPDCEQYTDEEMDAMSYEDKRKLLNKLEGVYAVCHDCGKKYGEYSVGCSSTWEGVCGVCGGTKPVTEARDYGYLMKGMSELVK